MCKEQEDLRQVAGGDQISFSRAVKRVKTKCIPAEQDRTRLESFHNEISAMFQAKYEGDKSFELRSVQSLGG